MVRPEYTMDTADPKNEEITDPYDDNVALVIAEKSSHNVIRLGPTATNEDYPIPPALQLALELDKNDPQLTESAKDYSKIIPHLREFRDVRQNHYWFLMKLLIYLEHYQQIADMSQYTLYDQKIKKSKFNNVSIVIGVPGLSEDRPSVRERDVVVLAQVKGKIRLASTVSFVGEKYITTKVTPVFIDQLEEDQSYNVFFLYPDYCINCMHHALDRAIEFDILPILFPTVRPTRKLQTKPNLVWINPSIKENPEQQQAIHQIMAKSAFPAPYILFGPPGTGKTSTLVEAICQILKDNPSNRILVCTPSNAAADEVALRLLKNYVNGSDIHRMYSSSRNGKDISDDLKPYSNFGEEGALYISKEIFIAKKIVLTTLITCHRLIHYKLRENHFSYVFVDEAGQATEPETLIPLTLMASDRDGHKGRLHGQLVIAGDPKQLGPSISSKIAEPLLGRSMLERLMEWDLYRKDETNTFNPTYVTKLVLNYRSHPAILHIPNQLFYDGELKACGGSHTERATTWKRLPKYGFPVIFHAVGGQEQREPRSPSVFNSEEVSVVMSYVNDLLSSKLGGRKVLQSEIGIVTPYRLQRQKIHDKLEKKKFKDISVGTVETFQGQERDIIIMSTVRTVIYNHSGRIHIGFLSNPKRFNVALTRAKALLIVIGNPVILQRDENWLRFIKYCHENRSCVGSDLLLEKTLSYAKMQQLMARKHVPVKTSNNVDISQIVEEEPAKKKNLQLPERSATRRRRIPRPSSSCEATNSEDPNGNDDSEGLNIIKYLKRGDEESSSDSDAEITDEWDMMGYFSESSLPASVSPPGPGSEPEHHENSWDTASSTMTADRSDKSPDSNESSYAKQTVDELTARMAVTKIVEKKIKSKKSC